jgi:hypothetical protein
MTDRITDEMVEAAARALHNDHWTEDEGGETTACWESCVPSYRAQWMRQARAALSAALPLMDGWQPILTAPTDGTEIVLVDGSGARAVGSWEQYGWADEEKFDWFPLRNPTHWMPLPPAPKGDE